MNTNAFKKPKNMKTLKNTLALAIVLFTASCTKKDEPAIAPIPIIAEVSLLTKTTDSDDGLISTYAYDNAKRLINFKRTAVGNNPVKNQNYTYNTDGTLDQIKNADETIAVRYFYDSNKKITKKEERNATDVFNYSYSGNQITEKYVFNGVASWIQVYTYDAKGNVLELKTYDKITAANPNGVLSGTFIYTYDDKKNASLSLPIQFLFPKTSINNLVTEKYNSEPVYTYKYEYNEKGYPTKRITSFTRTYEYQ
jgi:hypothetical protein